MNSLIKTEPWHVGILGPGDMIDTSNLANICLTSKGITLMDDETPIAVCGISTVHPGVGELWSMLSDRAKAKPLLLHKLSIKVVASFELANLFHRIQCVVKADDDMANKWIQSLGFVSEGIMIVFGSDKSDYVRYARVR